MSKKKRYEYTEGRVGHEVEYREKKKSHRLKPNDRWRKNDIERRYTVEDYEQEEWSEQ